MAKYFFCICLFILFPLMALSQDATIFLGTVTSLDNSSLPKSHIMLEPINNGLMFNSQKVEVQSDGHFKTEINKAGIYHVTVLGVLHKSLRFPLWVRKQDSLQISIKLDPQNLDDGQYFDSNEYISWIRTTGNFNGYNFDKGVRFERVDSTTLRTKITTSLDTLKYQIVGLTSGTTVLPGADDYQLRDRNNYEGVVAVKNDTVVLTYHADSTYYPNKNPYEGYRTTWDPDQTTYKFSSTNEEEIHKNLNANSYFRRLFDYTVLDDDSLRVDEFQKIMALVNKKRSDLHIKELKKVKELLAKNEKTSEADYLQSLYYKYLYLSRKLAITHQQSIVILKKDANMMEEIDLEIVRASMQSIPPSSILWSLRSDLINIYPEVLGYQHHIVSYLEQAVLSHPDNRVTGTLLFNLFTSSFDTEGNSTRTKKYYNYILEQFGDDYYARKAREYARNNE